MSKQIRNLTTASTITINDWLVLETESSGTYKASVAQFLNKLDATDIIAGNNINLSTTNNQVTITGVGIYYIAQFASTAPSVLASGQRYFNTIDNLIYTSDGTNWATSQTPQIDVLYLNLSEKIFYFYDGTTLSQILTKVKTDHVFTINSANINTLTNTADLLKINSGANYLLDFKVGNGYDNLYATLPNGDKFCLTSITSYNASALTDGTYNIFITADGTVSLLKNTLYIQNTLPTSPVSGDIWLNTVVSPYILENYTTSWSVMTTQVIPLGTATIASGAITAITTLDYNKKY